MDLSRGAPAWGDAGVIVPWTIYRAFNEAFVSPDGRIEGDTQTCYLLALHMGLLPEDLRSAAAEHLVKSIEREDWHLSTGFAGVGYLCPVLTEAGYTDVAYRLLGNETYPSWGYTIKNGATTIWERWDGWTEEHGFQSPNMNSFNHYSLGSVGEWLYRYVAGIDLDPQMPGYGRLIIRPRPGGGLTYARGEYDSVHGKISSAGRVRGEGFALEGKSPANAKATLHVPSTEPSAVTEGGVPLNEADGVEFLRADESGVVLSVGSGRYEFACRAGQV